MIEICALASGSNGNSYYIGNHDDAVLIDAGISAKQLLQRMNSRNLNPLKIKAVFLSHEHSDHSRGITVLAKKLGINIWMSKHTFYSLPKTSQPRYVSFFSPGQNLSIHSLLVHTFLKNHDAVEPCSFRVEHNGKSVGIFTDIGEPCEKVTNALRLCHGVFLETNYDEKMLWEGNYPWYLKKRIASNVGHLSNHQALQLVENHSHPELQCLFLSHLSQENNTPAVALSAFEAFSRKTKVILTSRVEASEVFTL